MRYILASASPRRKEILESVGLDFEIIVADADERSETREPIALTKELASLKGRAVMDRLIQEVGYDGETVIISADTVVVCDGEILGKPHSRDDAERMLRMLSGRTHEVVSGVALTYGTKTVTDASVTRVTFDAIDEAFLNRYLDTKEPYDKAGAYAVQGVASVIVNKLEGCYFGVVGLPINCLVNLAKKNGIPFEI